LPRNRCVGAVSSHEKGPIRYSPAIDDLDMQAVRLLDIRGMETRSERLPYPSLSSKQLEQLEAELRELVERLRSQGISGGRQID